MLVLDHVVARVGIVVVVVEYQAPNANHVSFATVSSSNHGDDDFNESTCAVSRIVLSKRTLMLAGVSTAVMMPMIILLVLTVMKMLNNTALYKESARRCNCDVAILRRG